MSCDGRSQTAIQGGGTATATQTATNPPKYNTGFGSITRNKQTPAWPSAGSYRLLLAQCISHNNDSVTPQQHNAAVTQAIEHCCYHRSHSCVWRILQMLAITNNTTRGDGMTAHINRAACRPTQNTLCRQAAAACVHLPASHFCHTSSTSHASITLEHGHFPTHTQP